MFDMDPEIPARKRRKNVIETDDQLSDYMRNSIFIPIVNGMVDSMHRRFRNNSNPVIQSLFALIPYHNGKLCYEHDNY